MRLLPIAVIYSVLFVLDSYATLDQRGRRNTLDDTLEPAENDIQVKTH